MSCLLLLIGIVTVSCHRNGTTGCSGFFHASGERENSGVRRFAAGCKTVFFSPSPISNRDFLIRQKSLTGPPSSP
ncbi:hypothetical protein [Culturomica massiliensis]|uniref:hypothetical protein n=1 Tax=Culturomica massiliensis TaxID=1841857 RepID=UPI0008395AD2|nr:hypothetical protein [Culturomica massiliensis]